jgi:hypothetical protein
MINVSDNNIDEVLQRFAQPKLYVVTDVVGIGSRIVSRDAYIPHNAYGFLPVFQTEEEARLAFPHSNIIAVNFA